MVDRGLTKEGREGARRQQLALHKVLDRREKAGPASQLGLAQATGKGAGKGALMGLTAAVPTGGVSVATGGLWGAARGLWKAPGKTTSKLLFVATVTALLIVGLVIGLLLFTPLGWLVMLILWWRA